MFRTDLFQGPLHAAGIQSSSLDAFASFNLLSHLISRGNSQRREPPASRGWQVAPAHGRPQRTFPESPVGNVECAGAYLSLHAPPATRYAYLVGFEVKKIVPAFDSDYDFLYDYSRIQDGSLKRRVTMLLAAV